MSHDAKRRACNFPSTSPWEPPGGGATARSTPNIRVLRVIDLARWRAEFPVVDRRTYLISASLGPLSLRSRALAEEHLDLWGTLGPEELWFEHGLPRLRECRQRFAALIGADEDEVAVIPSVSVGLSSLATCLDFHSRPKIVLSGMDFPTNHYVWLAQERVGAKLEVVSSPDGIRLEEADFVAAVDEQTAVVNINRVLFESSWIVDLQPIVSAAHDRGALVVVDDFHGSGIVPLDVHALDIDFLVTGALKWLCGGQGIAFLYCRRDLIESLTPRVVGWFGTQNPFDFDRSVLALRGDARRFENGTYALPQAWTAAGGLSIILEVGVDAIRARSQELTRAIIERVDEAGLDLLSPRPDDRRGGLVRVRIPGGRATAERILHQLFERDVVLDSRGDALRISPHFFNDFRDIDRCFAELGSLI
jgi:kynureninase